MNVDFNESARELVRRGEYDAALEAYSGLCASAPSDPAAWTGRGAVLSRLGSWPQAEEAFSKARALQPENVEAWTGLALSLAMQNKIYPALDAYEALLAAYPDCVRGHLQAGMLQFKLCAIAKGRFHMRRALESRPSLAERRMAEGLLKEQDELDKKRIYRPDFEALRARGRAAA